MLTSNQALPPSTNDGHTVRPPRSRSNRAAADAAFSAQQEMAALSAVRANLAVHHEELDDPDLMMLLAEGETQLLEALDFMLESDLHDEALIEGLKKNKDTLALRLNRLERRKASRRSIIEQALMLIEQKRLERPTATLILADRPPSLVVEEESQVPARFFDLRPALNRRELKAALEAGEEVPGAALSNGCATLTVRRR